LGLWMVSRGWEDFGWGLVVIAVVGFVFSSVHLVRVLRGKVGQGELPQHRPE
jgi:hypothetical protein